MPANWLGDKGYDPVYGARPLKRVIQKYVQDPLAEQILSGAGAGRIDRQDHQRLGQAVVPHPRHRGRRSGVSLVS